MCITKIQDDGEQRTKKDNEWTLNICGQLLCVRHLLTAGNQGACILNYKYAAVVYAGTR